MNYLEYIIKAAKDPKAAKVDELQERDFKSADEVKQWFDDNDVKLSDSEAQLLFDNKDALNKRTRNGGPY